MKVITISIIKITKRTVFQFPSENNSKGEDHSFTNIPNTERMQHSIIPIHKNNKKITNLTTFLLPTQLFIHGQ